MIKDHSNLPAGGIGGALCVATKAAAGAGRPQLWSVQILRGLAALMVVIGHTQSAIGQIAIDHGQDFTRSKALPWGAGVDLFFVISGFIMMYASQPLFGRPGAPRAFLARRIARIAPLYWVFTTLYLLILVIVSIKSASPTGLRLGEIVASYLFMPFGSAGSMPVPVLGLGWTLNYEMAFYLLFALLVGFGARATVVGVVLTLLAAVALGAIWQKAPAPIAFWTQPIILDFALGVLIGKLCIAGTTLPAHVRLLLIGAGALLFCADPFAVFDIHLGDTVPNSWPRVMAAGIPASLIMSGLLLGPHERLPNWLTTFTKLGDASYALYLSHPFVLILMEKLVQKSDLVEAVPLAILAAATVAAAIGVASCVFRYVERPLTKLATRLLVRGAPDGSRAGAAINPTLGSGGRAA